MKTVYLNNEEAISKVLCEVIYLILKDAKDKRTEASFSGLTDSGGADVLEAQVQFFQYGWKQTFPHEWEKYRQQAIKEADPDYATYLRLQRKFQ